MHLRRPVNARLSQIYMYILNAKQWLTAKPKNIWTLWSLKFHGIVKLSYICCCTNIKCVRFHGNLSFLALCLCSAMHFHFLQLHCLYIHIWQKSNLINLEFKMNLFFYHSVGTFPKSDIKFVEISTNTWSFTLIILVRLNNRK